MRTLLEKSSETRVAQDKNLKFPLPKILNTRTPE